MEGKGAIGIDGVVSVSPSLYLPTLFRSLPQDMYAASFRGFLEPLNEVFIYLALATTSYW